MSAPPFKKQKFQNKKKYQPNKKRQYLEVGQKGFLATCNFNEKDCVRECYNVLNEYADELYGPEEPNDFEGSKSEVNEGDEESAPKETSSDDIADELQKQVDSAQKTSKSFVKKRFQAVDTGATNCVFIKTLLDDPVAIATHIVQDISKTKKQKARFILRLVPVEVVCKANPGDIVQSAGTLCDKYFLQEPTTFSIVFNKRFNNDVNRDAVIREIADIVHAKNVQHKVDLKNAKKSLVIEVIKGLCCISVVSDYMQMKRYNLVELARENKDYDKKPEQSDSSKEDPKDDGEKAAADKPADTVIS